MSITIFAASLKNALNCFDMRCDYLAPDLALDVLPILEIVTHRYATYVPKKFCN